MRGACDGARSHMVRQRMKPASLNTLYNLSSQATPEAVHLLCRMLVFDPVSILTRDKVKEVMFYAYINYERGLPYISGKKNKRRGCSESPVFG